MRSCQPNPNFQVEGAGKRGRPPWRASDLYSCFEGFPPIASRGGGPPGHKRRLDYDFIIVLVKVLLLHWEYSFNLLGLLVPFLVILAWFPSLCCLSTTYFHSYSKRFCYYYESFAFSPMSRHYPSHTCLVLHVLCPPSCNIYPSAPLL